MTSGNFRMGHHVYLHLKCWGSSLIAVCALLCGSRSLATVRIEPTALEFGIVRPVSEQQQIITIRNDGPSPVQILGAEVECAACTRVRLEPSELAVGKTLEVPIVFTPPAKEMGQVQRKVEIKTSAVGSLTVQLHAFVTDTAALQPRQLKIEAPQQAGATINREVEVVNVSDEPLNLLYSVAGLDGPRLPVSHKPIAAGKRGKLTLTWHLPNVPGHYSGDVVLYVQHSKLSRLTLPYAVTVIASQNQNPPIAATTRDRTSVNVPTAVSSPKPSATTAPIASPATAPSSRMIHLELKDGLTLRDLVDVIAAKLQLNLVYDEAALNVPVAVRLAGPLPEDALLPLLRSVLQAKGFALSETERPEIWRIVTSKDAPQAVGTTSAQAGPSQVVTEVLTANQMEAEALAGVLKGFVTVGTGQITVVPDSKVLIVTDYKTQMQRLRDLVSLLDRGGPRAKVDVEMIPVKAAEVGPLTDRVNRFLSQIEQVEGPKTVQNKLFISPDLEHNQIVLVGRVTEFDRVREMILRFDTPPTTVRQSYALRDDQLVSVTEGIERIFGPSVREKAADGSPRIILASNSVSVAATEGQHERIRQLLEPHLAAVAAQELQLKVHRIQNRDAGEVEAILTRLLGGGDTAQVEEVPTKTTSAESPFASSGINRVGQLYPPDQTPVQSRASSPQAATPAPTTRAAAAPSRSIQGGLNIAVDASTNSLIVSATPELHARIGELIQQLDQRQAQVLLEVTLVSVSDTDTFSYAIEAAMRTTIGGSEQQIGTDFGIGSGPLSGRTSSVGSGLNAAILNPGAFSVFLRALAQTNKAKVMSLPQVLALDNKQALIRSVQQEPFISINASQTVSTTSFGGFAEAGTTLEVTPHIAPADYLNLEYKLEVSSFTGSSPAPSVPPPRRSDVVSSYITVPDGHTVIVGGLKSNSSSTSVSKIPGLGDIPLLGLLGRSQNQSHGSSTFYIFVRPTILRAQRFEDLKLLSRGPRAVAGIPSEFPLSSPLYIRP